VHFHSYKPRIRQDKIDEKPSTAPSRSVPAIVKWLVLTVMVLILTAVAGLWIINRELPAFIERQLNAHVDAYRFTVGQANLSPVLSLELRQLSMIQLDHPDPPVAVIPLWRLSIQWNHPAAGKARIPRGSTRSPERMARGHLCVLSHQDQPI